MEKAPALQQRRGTSTLQSGQLADCSNHKSMQDLWNECVQLGKLLRESPARKSPKHMEHSSDEMLLSGCSLMPPSERISVGVRPGLVLLVRLPRAALSPADGKSDCNWLTIPHLSIVSGSSSARKSDSADRILHSREIAVKPMATCAITQT